MKLVFLIAAILAAGLAGCSTATPMEELERQALITGDWIAVEKRQRMIARREARNGPQCPAGQMAYCEQVAAVNRCTCVARTAFRDAFASR